MQSHGLGPAAVDCVSIVQRAVCLYRVRLKFGLARQNFLIKFAHPMYLYFIARARDLFDPRHRTLVPLGQRIPVHCDDVTKVLTRMAVMVTP